MRRLHFSDFTAFLSLMFIAMSAFLLPATAYADDGQTYEPAAIYMRDVGDPSLITDGTGQMFCIMVEDKALPGVLIADDQNARQQFNAGSERMLNMGTAILLRRVDPTVVPLLRALVDHIAARHI